MTMVLCKRLYSVIALGVIVLACSGCEESFDPYQESELYFSIFGYLDASADTQFVRVSSIRSSMEPDPEPLDAVVSVEDLTTGVETVWRDSLFQIGNGGWVHNFWSTEPIHAERAYRFRVRRPDGAESAATVTLPPEFPEPSLDNGAYTGARPPLSQGIVIRGVPFLADLTFRLWIVNSVEPPNYEVYTGYYLKRAARNAQGFIAGFDLYADMLSAMSRRDCPTISRIDVTIASSAVEWPDIALFDEETNELPDIAGNVEHGVGFLGGVVSRRFEWPDGLQAMLANQYGCLERL